MASGRLLNKHTTFHLDVKSTIPFNLSQNSQLEIIGQHLRNQTVDNLQIPLPWQPLSPPKSAAISGRKDVVPDRWISSALQRTKPLPQRTGMRSLIFTKQINSLKRPPFQRIRQIVSSTATFSTKMEPN